LDNLTLPNPHDLDIASPLKPADRVQIDEAPPAAAPGRNGVCRNRDCANLLRPALHVPT
jgi:hypothetical protein